MPRVPGFSVVLTVDSPYTEGETWLRGNLHAHSTVSDGDRAPERVISDYAARGYDFLAVSDHDIFVDPEEYRGDTEMTLVPAVEVSDHLVETMRDRGVADARRGDMFSLREQFERDQFQSALAIGTQVGLAGSMQGLRRFLGDLAHVTTPDATAVFDGYDPESKRLRGEGPREDTTEENSEDPEGSGENTEESEQGPEKSGENPEESDQEAGMLGFRADPTPGLAYRLMWFDYEGTTGDGILFRLFSPDRVREAAVGTGWTVTDVRYTDEENPIHYRVALEKT